MNSLTIPESGWKIVHADCVASDGLPLVPDQSIDHTMTDPPYSAKTHEGQKTTRRDSEENQASWITKEGLSYDFLSEKDVAVLSEHYVRITRKWILVQTDHVLYPIWERELKRLGHYVFHPIPIIIPGMNVRIQGDGPSSWAIYLVVARPKLRKKWGTKPGGYYCSERHDQSVGGAKPLGLMQALVRDYTQPGESILDSHLGSGTTGIAAIGLGRRFLGIEKKLENFTCSRDRIITLTSQMQTSLFSESRSSDVQQQGIGYYDRSALDDVVMSEIEKHGFSGTLGASLPGLIAAKRSEISSSIKRLTQMGRVRSESRDGKTHYFPVSIQDTDSTTEAISR